MYPFPGSEPRPRRRPTTGRPKAGGRAPPKSRGSNSGKLAEGLLAIRQAHIPIHSLLLVRNSRIVVEAYFYPYDGQALHNVASVTKSLTTTLIGIAADQGSLSLDDRMVSFFPETTIANLDDRKKAISVRDLASMSAGMECSGLPDEVTVREMEASPDWVQFALDRPMAYKPGTHWEYCGLGMHLLSAILEKATGMTELEFARKYLFEPLGIQEAAWPADPQGVNLGAGNARLYPQDMAKLGFLWLHGGEWDGRQVVSSRWVQQSVAKRFQTGDDYYGYGWWISKSMAGLSYNADGSGGQRIAIDPGLHAVVVTTGGGFEFDQVVPYLTAAFLDLEKPLPANPQGNARLAEVLASLPQPPEVQPSASLPVLAGMISGRTIQLDPNAFRLESLRLDFNNPVEATVAFRFTDGRQTQAAPVGLDGLYRMTVGLDLDRAFHPFEDFENLAVGLRGAWVDQRTFRLEYDTIVDRFYYQLDLQFDGDQVSLRAVERGSDASATFQGHVQAP